MSAVLKPAIELRPMADCDIEAVMAVESEIYAFPWTQGNFRDSLSAGYGCWLYLNEGKLIGYAVIMQAADEAHLLNISIATPYQGQGHGGALLRRVCEISREMGARLIFLEVRPSNDGARRLYERHGFQHIGVRRGYYPAAQGREDAFIFTLPL